MTQRERAAPHQETAPHQTTSTATNGADGCDFTWPGREGREGQDYSAYGNPDGSPMNSDHARLLADSGICAEFAARRGYESAFSSTMIGIPKKAREDCGIGLRIPWLNKDGNECGFQFRPDSPRWTKNRSKGPIKYESPCGQPNRLDVPPGVGEELGDPRVPLFITEGTRKADAAAQRGLCCISIPGVDGWRGRNSQDGKVALPDWNDLALNNRQVVLAFDGDVSRKESVHDAMRRLSAYLEMKGAEVSYLHLPDTLPFKTGLDDYLTNHTVEELWRLVKPNMPPTDEHEAQEEEEPPEPVDPISLAEAHHVFRRWLGDDYDLDALDAMLAVAAVERFDDSSESVWLLLISGSGNAKTETVQSLDGINATITSSISSEAALLSGTAQRECAKNATGGLLRKMGARGVLVIKDVTSVLSMNRDTRTKVLAALREIYDGRWYREMGVDGGKTLEWKGRIAVIGAVTTAWDTHHAVISAMGDRFVLIRIDSSSSEHRLAAGRQAIANTGSESQMKGELSRAVAGVLAGMNPEPITITEAEEEMLLKAADLVCLARTGVERDYRGDVINAHAPEVPTRFAKQLTQVVRGGVAIGMYRTDALVLAIRCARDSMPPLRLAIIDDLAEHPRSTPTEVSKRIGKPRATVDRELQALHMLGIAEVEDVVVEEDTKRTTRWLYSLNKNITPGVLNSNPSPEMSVQTHIHTEGEGQERKQDSDDTPQGGCYKSGKDSGSEGDWHTTTPSPLPPSRPEDDGPLHEKFVGLKEKLLATVDQPPPQINGSQPPPPQSTYGLCLTKGCTFCGPRSPDGLCPRCQEKKNRAQSNGHSPNRRSRDYPAKKGRRR